MLATTCSFPGDSRAGSRPRFWLPPRRRLPPPMPAAALPLAADRAKGRRPADACRRPHCEQPLPSSLAATTCRRLPWCWLAPRRCQPLLRLDAAQSAGWWQPARSRDPPLTLLCVPPLTAATAAGRRPAAVRRRRRRWLLPSPSLAAAAASCRCSSCCLPPVAEAAHFGRCHFCGPPSLLAAAPRSLAAAHTGFHPFSGF